MRPLPAATVEAGEPSPASALAAEVKALVARGEGEQARERFAGLVALLQRRALRIAFQYLRDAADAEEAVQDAFLKVFLHIEQYREQLPFDVWFTRILVNAALDLVKARARRHRWVGPGSGGEDTERPMEHVPSDEASHERRLLARERLAKVHALVAALPDRQRLVFTLCHLDGLSPAAVAGATGMSQATVRVHLFRALKKLRHALGEET